MLYMIGIGLGNEKDITLNQLDILKNSDLIYLECYTSMINFNIKDLEILINKNIILADRNLVENSNDIIDNSISKNVCFLVKGDVFSATTHSDLFLRAKSKNIKVKILHNASIINAVSDSGLSLYKFGKISSIPFDNKNIETPYEILLENRDMHTLFLLDLDVFKNKYMNFKEALVYLLRLEKEKNNNLVNEDTYVVVCAALGTADGVIKYGKISDLLKLSIEIYPQCIIIPGKLHFIEEEMLNNYK